MNYKTIELQLRQLEEAFSKSRSNIYSDNKKEAHFQELHALFKKIKDSDYKNFTLPEIRQHIFLFKVIFEGLEYLDSSTLNVIPYEIIDCLEYALTDWIDNQNFIIVTSLSNKMNDFYLKTTLDEEKFKLFNDLIQFKYNLKLTHRLIQISLPKILSRDYLSCVVLYHELGHFVDTQLNISSKLLFKKHLTPKPTTQENFTYYRHKMEFFADLFAAQYVSDASNIYLNHISSENSDSDTHPSTKSRIKIVNDFLTSTQNDIIAEFNQVLDSSGLEKFQKRHQIIKTENSTFKDLYPQKFNSKEELHYVFKLGWELWNNSETNFLKEFTDRQKYNIINNLIEKSISNYVIQENWKNTKK